MVLANMSRNFEESELITAVEIVQICKGTQKVEDYFSPIIFQIHNATHTTQPWKWLGHSVLDLWTLWSHPEVIHFSTILGILPAGSVLSCVDARSAKFISICRFERRTV